jgi:hypothetical protein
VVGIQYLGRLLPLVAVEQVIPAMQVVMVVRVVALELRAGQATEPQIKASLVELVAVTEQTFHSTIELGVVVELAKRVIRIT